MAESLSDDLRALLSPRGGALPRLDRLLFALVVAGALALAAADITQRWILPDNVWVLDIDGRFNVVTWFHSLVLAGAAFSAGGIALTTERPGVRRQWLALAVGLAFLSLDKSISLHERVGENIEEALSLSSEAGRLIWVLVYAPLLGGIALLLALAALRADAAARRWVAVGLALCASKVVVEAALFPIIESGLISESGVAYGIEVNLEEGGQLLGFGAFLAAFAQMLVDRLGRLPRGEPVDVEPVVEPASEVAAAATPIARPVRRPAAR